MPRRSDGALKVAVPRNSKKGQNILGPVRINADIQQLLHDYCALDSSLINVTRALNRCRENLRLLFATTSTQAGVVEACVAVLRKWRVDDWAGKLEHGDLSIDVPVDDHDSKKTHPDPFIQRYYSTFSAFRASRKSVEQGAVFLNWFFCAMAHCLDRVQRSTIVAQLADDGHLSLSEDLAEMCTTWAETHHEHIQGMRQSERSTETVEQEVAGYMPNKQLISKLWDSKSGALDWERVKTGDPAPQTLPWSWDEARSPMDDASATMCRTFDTITHTENPFITTKHSQLLRQTPAIEPRKMAEAAIKLGKDAAKYVEHLEPLVLVADFEPAKLASDPDTATKINYDFLYHVETFLSADLHQAAVDALHHFCGRTVTDLKLNDSAVKCRGDRRKWLTKVLDRLVENHGGVAQWRQWLPIERKQMLHKLIMQQPLWIISMAFWHVKGAVDLAVVCANPTSPRKGCGWANMEKLQLFCFDVILAECELIWKFDIDLRDIDRANLDQGAVRSSETILHKVRGYIKTATMNLTTEVSKAAHLGGLTFRDMPTGDFRTSKGTAKSLAGVAKYREIHRYVQTQGGAQAKAKARKVGGQDATTAPQVDVTEAEGETDGEVSALSDDE